LHDVIETNGENPLCLIGFSWGAWLSFMVAAHYPALVQKLILIGSGAFQEKYAANIVAERLTRLSEAERIEVLELTEKINKGGNADKDNLMLRFGGLFAKADAYAPLPHDNEVYEFSEEINRVVWAEAREMRVSGELLSLGKQITCPVVAIHGEYDPHLAEGVREPLARVLKDFKFILLEKCGHEPWIEKYARDQFYEILKNELQ
jgi:pimeloyl-ACP methyl ester carboxylesterase